MKVLIIEDNEVEMENLKILLADFEGYHLVGTANTIGCGIELANTDRPGLIMLDIQLECQNSLEHIHELDYTPFIICSTLYTEHALQAFEVGVTDYLTKPVTFEKLDRALGRLPALDALERPTEALPLNNGVSIQMVRFCQIIQIIADRDYTVVRDDHASEFLCTRRMHDWIELLPANLFISLDRSTIINREQVASFSQLDDNRTSTITFQNGQVLEIGATALRRLKSILK